MIQKLLLKNGNHTILKAALALFIWIALPLAAQAQDLCADPYDNQVRENVCRQVNRIRADRGLPRVQLVYKLTKVARAHAQDMNARDYLSHTSPEGETYVMRLREAGISYTAAGENIAWGYTTVSSVISGWMNSEGHRRNILNPNFRKIGVGRSGSYWVQDFTN